MSAIPDPVREGLARGWKVLGGLHGEMPARLACDVVVVGSGAGGGITAEVLARAGLQVVMVEEGPLKSSNDFRQREAEAYTQLYQECAARKTADKAINILQGRCVGGSTTVNWTASFRTPPETLAYWRRHFGLDDFNPAALAPFFEQAERRLSIAQPTAIVPNENNESLRRGAARLGFTAHPLARNVSDCRNLGSCGMGCPTNAKQSMLVTCVPAALDEGATLLVQTRAERLQFAQGRAVALHCTSQGRRVAISARHFVVAGGAINSPGLLLRSEAPDPHERLGVRSFLHPTVLSAAVMPLRVEGWRGAPQTLYADHYLDTQPIDGPIGFKLEVPPLHPAIAASTLPGWGQAQAEMMRSLPDTHALIALLRDGFHAESPGGHVRLRGDGSPELDYPLTPFVMQGARRALLAMAEMQFAAGARQVLPMHEMARPYRSWGEAREAIEQLPIQPLLTRVVSAHVMGGCGMAASPRQGVVRPDGTHWQLDNLSVHDGSLFPTSLGANPQLSIYGIVNRLSQALAVRLGGQPVILA